MNKYKFLFLQSAIDRKFVFFAVLQIRGNSRGNSFACFISMSLNFSNFSKFSQSAKFMWC